MDKAPATYRLWSDERKAKYLIALIKRGDWGRYFMLSENNRSKHGGHRRK